MDRMVVRFPGGKRVVAEHAGHVIETDQSKEHGGDGAAPEPFSLFLASLATCAGVYVLGFCQARGIPTAGLELVQSHEYDADTRTLRAVHIDVLLPEGFPTNYVAAVRQAAASCKVKKLLAHPPQIEVLAGVRRSTAA